MTEALIISAVVLTSLVLIYMQFSRLNRHYNDSYYYYNVNDIYALKQFATYLDTENTASLKSSISTYVDITNCSQFSKTSYCRLLVDAANIKYLLMTKRDRSVLVNALKSSNPYDLRMLNFASVIDDSDTSYTYMLVAEFKDGSFAALPY